MIAVLGGIAMDLSPHRDTLRQLTRTDPDPRVRHWIAGLLLVASKLSVADAAWRLGCSRNSLRTWGSAISSRGAMGWRIEGDAGARQS